MPVPPELARGTHTIKSEEDVTMARFYAYTAANNVGDGNPPAFSSGGPWDADTLFLYYGAPSNPPPNDYIVLIDTDFGSPGNIFSYGIYDIDLATVVVGDNSSLGQQYAQWYGDGGFFSFSQFGSYLSSSASTQTINAFFFQYNDKIYGSNEGDDLSGWWGNDKVWLGKGEDYCYFSDGQGKDQYKKFNWKKDMMIFDTDLGDPKKTKFKNDKKTVVKFDDGDKVVFKGKKVPQNAFQLNQSTDEQDWLV